MTINRPVNIELHDMPNSGFLPHFRASFRREASSAVRPPGTEERRYSRVQLPIPAEISCVALGHFRQPAHLLNISAGGAFLYTQVTPSVGTAVKVDFAAQVVGGEIQISCEGSVVRVEPRVMGDQSGLAVQFSQLNLGAW